jgi:hypothetical protein
MVRRQLDAANAMIESANGFTDTVGRQRQHLDVIGLFRPEVERDTCPVCERIGAVVSEAEETRERLSLDERRLRVAGRVRSTKSLFHKPEKGLVFQGFSRWDPGFWNRL